MNNHAPLDVQLIGHTVFDPPVIRGSVNANGVEQAIFWPDDENAGNYPYHDGQALIEFAGRACYQSFDRPNPKTATNQTYMANILSVGHFSVLEHSNATFYIQGVSRSLTHELVRHRHLSPSQLSQRFVDGSNASFVVPPALADDEATSAVLGRVMEIQSDSYAGIVTLLENDGLGRKQAREAARAVLPNMTETKIVLTGNYRAWLEFLHKRDSEHADKEIARLARNIASLLADLAPNVFADPARTIWQPLDQRSQVAS